MKKIMLILLVFTMLFGLTSCKEKIMTDPSNQNNGRVIGHIHGIVRDANTSEVLDGITVSWYVKGKSQSTTTDKKGYYAISNLVSGDYELTFTGKEAYTTQLKNITVPDLSEIGIVDVPTNSDFNYSMVEDFELYQANAKVVGFVRARTSTSDLQAVPNMKIIAAVLDYDFVPAYYQTFTDANGKYQFNNLPAIMDKIYIYAAGNTKIGDYYYSTSSSETVYPIANQTVQANTIELQINEEEVIIISHTAEEYTRGSTIEITFDKEINQSTFKHAIYRDGTTNIGSGNYSISWINVKKMRITFAEGFFLSPNTYYEIELTGQAKPIRGAIPNFETNLEFVTKNFN